MAEKATEEIESCSSSLLTTASKSLLRKIPVLRASAQKPSRLIAWLKAWSITVCAVAASAAADDDDEEDEWLVEEDASRRCVADSSL